MDFDEIGRGSYVNMNVTPIPSLGLRRLRVGGLASQLVIDINKGMIFKTLACWINWRYFSSWEAKYNGVQVIPHPD